MTDACPYCQGTGLISASLSTRLVSLRKAKSATQDEVAQGVGISRTQIVNLERGRGDPSIKLLIRIATYFNVSTDYLLGIKRDEP